MGDGSLWIAAMLVLAFFALILFGVGVYLADPMSGVNRSLFGPSNLEAIRMRQNTGRRTGQSMGHTVVHDSGRGYGGDTPRSNTSIALTCLFGGGILAGAAVGIYEWHHHCPGTPVALIVVVGVVFLLTFAMCCAIGNE